MNAVPQWMQTHQVAEYAGRHHKTVLKAVQTYQRTQGRKGLEGYQSAPRARHTIPREAVDRWLRGEPPKKTRSRIPAAV
ncbi:hypothetical protein [Amycolatopsis palatopharyngis]|uniref:hypothetical protein n=1 Tax=Amycolatopsis palatopharyngis TaxID=187982 RepID=UPI000E288EE3|nr:hypothetical protein [Amycolatopsis palatopharyngis]